MINSIVNDNCQINLIVNDKSWVVSVLIISIVHLLLLDKVANKVRLPLKACAVVGSVECYCYRQ